MIIVEYCRFGNLRDYLFNNRNCFVNQLDDLGNLTESDYTPGTISFIPEATNHYLHKNNKSDISKNNFLVSIFLNIF